MWPPFLLWLFVQGSVPTATEFVLPAAASSAFADAEGLWLLTDAGPGAPRAVYHLEANGRLRRAPPPPPDAIAMDRCALAGETRRTVYQDRHGIRDETGRRLLRFRPLFATVDEARLLHLPLCGSLPGTLVGLGLDGWHLLGQDGQSQHLSYPPAMRSYAGRTRQGLRTDRRYAAAVSLFHPELQQVDLDGDQRPELVALFDGNAAIFPGQGGGRYRDEPRRVALRTRVGASPTAELRVLWADLTKDGRADWVVLVSEGLAPENSHAFWLDGALDPSAASAEPLFTGDGLWMPANPRMGVQPLPLQFVAVDTGLSSLASAILTGSVSVQLHALHGVGQAPRPGRVLSVERPARGSQPEGHLPIAGLDWDGDGRGDLLDLGQTGQVRLLPGGEAGDTSGRSRSWPRPKEAGLLVLPRLRGLAPSVVFLAVGAGKRRTEGVWLRGAEPADGASAVTATVHP